MPPRVFITRTLPETVMIAMTRRFEVLRAEPDRPLSAAEIAHGARDCEGLVSMLSDPIGDTVLAACPKLRVVANFAAGTNNVDLAAAKRRGITVTNTPGVLTEATADMAFALLLAVARRIVEGDALTRSGRWNGWGPTQLLGQGVQARRLGIVGMGRIGQAVARRAQGFGMDVVYHNRHRVDERTERSLDCHWVPLDELLRTSDYISLHCPLTPETRNLLSAEAFRTIKHGAYLINTARGEVVDEDAMIDALESGALSGAGLDVYTGEPRVNPRILALSNVVAAPHAGSATYATRDRMGMMVFDNLSAALAGQTPPNRVV
ncbi:MAG: D-glycerate dehydrogenase [Nitrospirae bacterium]|nr:D-glycerate dehydrogenase [Nitrospirota bacterium]